MTADRQKISTELKALFPNDTAKVRMAFALAIAKEQDGDHEKAEEYLDKAIAAEEAA